MDGPWLGFPSSPLGVSGTEVVLCYGLYVTVTKELDGNVNLTHVHAHSYACTHTYHTHVHMHACTCVHASVLCEHTGQKLSFKF